jgi:hypothetical protein
MSWLGFGPAKTERNEMQGYWQDGKYIRIETVKREITLLKNALREAVEIIMGEYPKQDERYILAERWSKLANE